jgi:hypothetical protein
MCNCIVKILKKENCHKRSFIFNFIFIPDPNVYRCLYLDTSQTKCPFPPPRDLQELEESRIFNMFWSSFALSCMCKARQIMHLYVNGHITCVSIICIMECLWIEKMHRTTTMILDHFKVPEVQLKIFVVKKIIISVFGQIPIFHRIFEKKLL